MTGIAWTRFESIMNNIPDVPTLKEKFIKKVHFMGIIIAQTTEHADKI